MTKVVFAIADEALESCLTLTCLVVFTDSFENRDFVSSSSERLLRTSEHVTSFGPPCLLVWIESYNLDDCATGTRTTRVTQDRAWFKMYASLPHPILCFYQSRRKSIHVISHPCSLGWDGMFSLHLAAQINPLHRMFERASLLALTLRVFSFWYNWTKWNCLDLTIKVVL